jgi:hypothetical protein
MPAKEIRSEQSPISQLPPQVNLKALERFLRLLTWQMFFLLALLFYLAFRPQAGRYQVILGKDEIVVFDTSSLRVVPVKPQQISGAAAGDKTTPSVSNTPANPPPATPETK